MLMEKAIKPVSKHLLFPHFIALQLIQIAHFQDYIEQGCSF